MIANSDQLELDVCNYVFVKIFIQSFTNNFDEHICYIEKTFESFAEKYHFMIKWKTV